MLFSTDMEAHGFTLQIYHSAAFVPMPCKIPNIT